MVNQAPDWFVRHLRSINPSLGVRRKANSRGWEVTQSIPYWKNHGAWQGSPLIELVKVPERVLEIPEIGSRTFFELKKLWAPKFSYEEFCKVNNIRMK